MNYIYHGHYKSCVECGANLDLEEICDDCEPKKEPRSFPPERAPVTQTTSELKMTS